MHEALLEAFGGVMGLCQKRRWTDPLGATVMTDLLNISFSATSFYQTLLTSLVPLSQ